MDLVATLVLGHLLADFPLQSNAIAAAKAKSIYGLMIHILVHIAIVWILLSLDGGIWPLLLSVGTTHFVIDWAKSCNKRMTGISGFIIDQIAHYLCIFAICWYVPNKYSLDVQLLLPTSLLHFSVIIGFCLPTIVLYWLWLNSIYEPKTSSPHWLVWNNNQLLLIEQRAGLGLIFVLSLSIFLNHLP